MEQRVQAQQRQGGNNALNWRHGYVFPFKVLFVFEICLPLWSWNLSSTEYFSWEAEISEITTREWVKVLEQAFNHKNVS